MYLLWGATRSTLNPPAALDALHSYSRAAETEAERGYAVSLPGLEQPAPAPTSLLCQLGPRGYVHSDCGSWGLCLSSAPDSGAPGPLPGPYVTSEGAKRRVAAGSVQVLPEAGAQGLLELRMKVWKSHPPMATPLSGHWSPPHSLPRGQLASTWPCPVTGDSPPLCTGLTMENICK